jgi:hypothetical protein
VIGRPAGDEATAVRSASAGADGREGGVSPAPHPSARVRLEAALLDDGETWAPAPAVSAPDGGVWRTVLVVAAEPDLRRYVRECLRDCPELRVVEAATVATAVALAAVHPLACLVVDEPEREVLRALTLHCAVLLGDDAPRDAAPSGTRLRLLAGPFTAEGLVAAVRRLVE